MKRLVLPRRTLLRGLGGVAVGLPVLECMLNGNGTAYAQAGELPKRYAIVFAGQAIGGDAWEEDRHMVAGERSMAVRLELLDPEATWTDEGIDAVVKAAVVRAGEATGARLRG